MKQTLLTLGLMAFTFGVKAQCTPVNCSANLPSFGGICDSILNDAVVNLPYSDFESFVVTNQCFDAGLIDPSAAGTNIRIARVDNFTYAQMPQGLTGATNAAFYAPSNNNPSIAGCIAYSGTPTQVGFFRMKVNFLADVVVCGFLPINQNDNPAFYDVQLTVKPNPSFSGLANNYCITDGVVTLTPTGTTGGTFSGPGVIGNTFDPSIAGVGTHQVKYVVSRQEGAAIAPAADSLILTVVVNAGDITYYADADGDGFGDLEVSVQSCSQPVGYVDNALDCDDTNNAIHPNSTEICDGIDNNCNNLTDEGLTFVNYYVDADNDGVGAGDPVSLCANPGAGFSTTSTDCDDNNPQVSSLTNYYVDADGDGFGAGAAVPSCGNPGMSFSVNNTDCNDNNPNIYPGATEIPNNGIDEDCSGSDLNTSNLTELSKIQPVVYPNPTNELLNVISKVMIENLQIFNLNGQKIFETSSIAPVLQINVSTFEDGIYFLEAQTSAGKFTSRFVVKK